MCPFCCCCRYFNIFSKERGYCSTKLLEIMVWPSQGDGCNVYCYFNEMTIMKINPCALSHLLFPSDLHIGKHSAAMVNLTNLQKTLMVSAQVQQVCLKDSKYILFEILANRTWKGCASSCRPSQPNRQIGVAWPAGAYMARPCPI